MEEVKVDTPKKTSSKKQDDHATGKLGAQKSGAKHGGDGPHEARKRDNRTLNTRGEDELISSKHAGNYSGNFSRSKFQPAITYEVAVVHLVKLFHTWYLAIISALIYAMVTLP